MRNFYTNFEETLDRMMAEAHMHQFSMMGGPMMMGPPGMHPMRPPMMGGRAPYGPGGMMGMPPPGRGPMFGPPPGLGLPPQPFPPRGPGHAPGPFPFPPPPSMMHPPGTGMLPQPPGLSLMPPAPSFVSASNNGEFVLPGLGPAPTTNPHMVTLEVKQGDGEDGLGQGQWEQAGEEHES